MITAEDLAKEYGVSVHAIKWNTTHNKEELMNSGLREIVPINDPKKKQYSYTKQSAIILGMFLNSNRARELRTNAINELVKQDEIDNLDRNLKKLFSMEEK